MAVTDTSPDMSNSTHRLTFDQERQLIEYFRDNPSLWNTKDREYNNRTLRTQKLEIIAHMLGMTRQSSNDDPISAID